MSDKQILKINNINLLYYLFISKCLIKGISEIVPSIIYVTTVIYEYNIILNFKNSSYKNYNFRSHFTDIDGDLKLCADILGSRNITSYSNLKFHSSQFRYIGNNNILFLIFKKIKTLY